MLSEYKEEKEEKKLKKGIRQILPLILVVILSLAISGLIVSFYRPSVVDGISMNNTLEDGDWLIIKNKPYKENVPEYKDIVVIERKDLSIRYIIKRVIGVPGDKIVIKDNKLYKNDALLEEDYIKEEMLTEDSELTVPEGKVFVMGDNRNNSLDSRSNIIGLVDIQSEILGKAVFNISQFEKIE